MNLAIRRGVLLSLVALCSACGFQLRQQVSLPPALSRLQVITPDPYGNLQRDLELALRRGGASLATQADGAAVVRVTAARIDRLPLSVGDTGRVSEYLLRYLVEFELVDSAARVVLPRQTIQLDRDYTFDTAQAFGTPGEEELVKAELERDMVQNLMRRIGTASRAQD